MLPAQAGSILLSGKAVRKRPFTILFLMRFSWRDTRKMHAYYRKHQLHIITTYQFSLTLKNLNRDNVHKSLPCQADF